MAHPYVTIVMKHCKKVHHYREVVVDAYLPVYQAISLKGFDTQQHLLAHAILELTSSKIDLRNPSLEVHTLIFEGALAWF